MVKAIDREQDYSTNRNWRIPPVHWIDLEGQQRVNLKRSQFAFGTGRYCRKAPVAPWAAFWGIPSVAGANGNAPLNSSLFAGMSRLGVPTVIVSVKNLPADMLG
jgi:hypothetical protein